MRAFVHAELEPAPVGVTVLTGPNGCGKTTLLEAVDYLSTQRSFRVGAGSRGAMVRAGTGRAIVRAELCREGRPLLVESELPATGPPRTQVNRRPARSRGELALAVPVTVFSPEDLAITQGPPAGRRALLDDAIRSMDAEGASSLDELERVLRQRGALLRQAQGRLTADVAATLDVWDERLVKVSAFVVISRRTIVESLRPLTTAAYEELTASARTGGALTMEYRSSWEGDLAEALAARRTEDVRRAVSTVGPHRDDLELHLAGRDARTQASQGEQRSIALALRIGAHQLVTKRTGTPPVLLLDDVFSELDPGRSRALVRLLPSGRGQALLTTAVPLSAGISVALTLDVGSLGERA